MFDLGQNFDFKKLSTLLICSFFDRSNIFELIEYFFQKFEFVYLLIRLILNLKSINNFYTFFVFIFNTNINYT